MAAGSWQIPANATLEMLNARQDMPTAIYWHFSELGPHLTVKNLNFT